MGRKNRRPSKAWKYIGITLLAVFILAILGGAIMFAVGGDDKVKTDAEGNVIVPPGDFRYSYVGSNVEYELDYTHSYNGTTLNGVAYVYEEEPVSWGEGRVTLKDGFIASYTATTGTATVKQKPGTYWIRTILSGYYDDFTIIVIPAGGDATLSDYNNGGAESTAIRLINVETLTTANLDLGLTSATANSTTDKTYQGTFSFTVSDDKGYCLDEIILKEDATYSFATDTDSNGIYDEGINYLELKFQGVDYVPFQVATSIDEFASDNEYKIDLDNILFEQNSVISGVFKVIADQTANESIDGDEYFGDGEGILDDIVFVDCAGNTATFELIG